MARDTERYAYFNVGIPRESALYQKIMHDARERGMLDAIARLLVVRLGDFYEPGLTVVAPADASAEPVPQKTAPPVEEGIDEEMAAQNASAALDAWL